MVSKECCSEITKNNDTKLVNKRTHTYLLKKRKRKQGKENKHVLNDCSWTMDNVEKGDKKTMAAV